MEENIQKLVNAANSTNATAREIGLKKLKELGLDKDGKPLEAAKPKEEKPKAERKKREPKAKEQKPKKADIRTDNDAYCKELIDEAEKRKAKAKAAAEKRASMPKKTPATKNKEAVEKTAGRIEKNVEKRAKKGDVTVSEIEKLISEYEDAIKNLRALITKIKADGKMSMGGGIGESHAAEYRKIKNHTCKCGDKMAGGGGIYSSDEVYILKVYDLNGKLLDTKRFQERNIKRAKEYAIDMFEYDMQQKHGSDLRFSVTLAPAMAEGGGIEAKKYKKDWEVVGITLDGKKFKKTITLGRLSNKSDVQQAIKRMGNVREVTSITEVKSYASGGVMPKQTAQTYTGKDAIKGIEEEIAFYTADNGTIIQLLRANDRSSDTGRRYYVTINGRGLYAREYREDAYDLYRNEIEKYKNNYGKGGKLVTRNSREYPTGSAWTIEHKKRNKGEKWEQYADGGNMESPLARAKKKVAAMSDAEVAEEVETILSYEMMDYDQTGDDIMDDMKAARKFLTEHYEEQFTDINITSFSDGGGIEEINPQLNKKILERAEEIYASIKGKNKKDFDDSFDKAIIEYGYDPSKYHSVMRNIGAMYDDDIEYYGKGGGVGKVRNVMHEFKEGTLHSGRSGKKVEDRKQAIAIALSEAGMSKKMVRGGGINKKYKYFAVGKQDNKIVDAWELISDVESLKYYAKIDLKDNDLNPKDYKIVSGKFLLSQGINPFDTENWKKR